MNYKPLTDDELGALEAKIQFGGWDLEDKARLRTLIEQAWRANAVHQATISYWTRDSWDEVPGSAVELRKRRRLERAINNYGGADNQ